MDSQDRLSSPVSLYSSLWLSVGSDGDFRAFSMFNYISHQLEITHKFKIYYNLIYYCNLASKLL